VKRWLLAALVLLLPWGARAEISYQALARLALAPEFLQGSFTQEKYLGALDATLVSTGEFTYQRGKSIRWAILEPVQSELILTPSSISSRQGQQLTMQLDASSNPVARVIGEIFFAVLTTQWEKLAPYFELSGTIDGQRWQAVLLPVDPAVRQLFSRIELSGARLLDEIVLHETNGDRTTIRLFDQHQ